MSTPPQQEWYASGLKFQCTQCGKCCTGAPGYVWVLPEEIRAIANALNISEESCMRQYIRKVDNRYALIEMKSRNFDCIFLKDKKCRIYAVRPRQCRTFPWWKENLSSEESWKHLSTYCEGVRDSAPCVEYEKIQTSLAENNYEKDAQK